GGGAEEASRTAATSDRGRDPRVCRDPRTLGSWCLAQPRQPLARVGTRSRRRRLVAPRAGRTGASPRRHRVGTRPRRARGGRRHARALARRRPHRLGPRPRPRPAHRPGRGAREPALSASRFRLPLALPHVHRSEHGRVVAGVCSGVAEALDVDPTFVRLTAALLAFADGAGIVAYLGGWAILSAPGGAGVSQRRRVAGAAMLVWA